MSNIKMKIYNNSPIWVQNILTTVQGYILKKERYSDTYSEYLKELQNRDYTNHEFQNQYQINQMKQLINFAKNKSPFYKDFYKDVDISNVKQITDITKLPILSKEMVRKNIYSFYTLLESDGITSNTSGTTGTSIKFIYTKDDMQKRLAYLDHFKAQHGFKSLEMRRASFTTAKIIPPNQKSKIFWRDNKFVNQRLYSGYHCKEENALLYIKDLNKYKPKSIDGLPSSIYELARYVIAKGINLTFTPLAIFPTAETLYPHHKKVIEKAFNCPVRNQYASSEGAPFITECKHGKLHYNIDTGIIEVMDDGEMIVTCFETYGTPLIRYSIGDRIILSEKNETCKCGSIHPLVESIEGRNVDYLVSKSKGKYPAIYLSLVSEEFDNSIKRMQFIQNNIDEIEILLETDEKYRLEMNEVILEKLRYSLGEDMKFNIKKVDEIPKEVSGKFRLIKNNIQQ